MQSLLWHGLLYRYIALTHYSIVIIACNKDGLRIEQNEVFSGQVTKGQSWTGWSLLGLGHKKGQSETNCNRHVSLISIKIKMWFFIFSFKKAFLTCFGNFYRILLAIVMQRSLSPSNFFKMRAGTEKEALQAKKRKTMGNIHCSKSFGGFSCIWRWRYCVK